ncbi:YIEGIA domain-containing protein, partial [Bacillus pumilus]|uniref:YIEGIA domain-containing protein n=1 Tax=Bacillus pumilus TaxID=1408 RepID=UPI0021B2BC0F
MATLLPILSFFFPNLLVSPTQLNHILNIQKPHLPFHPPPLYLNHIYIINIGLPQNQNLILHHPIPFLFTPKNFNPPTTIANLP